MLNNVSIIGRITSDPELRETPDGTKVTSFVIAVDRPYLDKDGKRPADFIDIIAWRGAAEFVCNNFTKSDYVTVSGTLQSRHFTDKNGNSRKAVEVLADRIDFCGYKRTPQE